MNDKRLDGLDTLRGIAILMVLCVHVAIAYPPPASLLRIVEFGAQGVQLFFLVSAVTMCHMLDQRRNEPDRVVKFYIRRVMRIAPLFWLAMLLYTLLFGVAPRAEAWDGIGPFQIAVTALFLHGFTPRTINAVVPGGWSIAVEMSFYVIFPLLARLSASRLLIASFLSYLVFGLLLSSVISRFSTEEHIQIFLYYSLLTQLPIFPIGMLTYAISMRGEKISWALIFSIALVWLIIAFAGKYFGLLGRPFFWIQIALFSILVWSVLRFNLGNRILGFIGQISYSMYLFHFAVLHVLVRTFGPGWPFPVALAVTLSLTMIIAMLSRQTAEKWSQDVGRALVAKVDRLRGRGLRAAV